MKADKPRNYPESEKGKNTPKIDTTPRPNMPLLGDEGQRPTNRQTRYQKIVIEAYALADAALNNMLNEDNESSEEEGENNNTETDAHVSEYKIV